MISKSPTYLYMSFCLSKFIFDVVHPPDSKLRELDWQAIYTE